MFDWFDSGKLFAGDHLSAGHLDYAALRATVGTRHLSIHVGAHYHDLKTEDFVVAFDPHCPPQLTSAKLLLPHVVTAEASPKYRPFYVGKNPTCSSLLRTANKGDLHRYLRNGALACERFANATPRSEWSAPPA